jgi:hypothetical protein
MAQRGRRRSERFDGSEAAEEGGGGGGSVDCGGGFAFRAPEKGGGDKAGDGGQLGDAPGVGRAGEGGHGILEAEEWRGLWGPSRGGTD